MSTGLSIRDLRVDYGAAPALRGVDLELPPGGRIALVGASGSGKSTLARAVLGVLGQGSHVAGRIELDGVDLLTMERAELDLVRWRRIALGFQTGLDAMNPVLTVGEHLAEPLSRHAGLRGAGLRDRVAEALRLVDLDPALASARAHELSGGQRQLVLIAAALAVEPDHLILDEPTSALDPDRVDGLAERIDELQRRRGFGLLTITHDLPLASRLADRVHVILDGRILESGPVGELLDEPQHPYTRDLVRADPAISPLRDLWGIRGEGSAPPEGGCRFAGRCTQEVAACRGAVPDLAPAGPGRLVACHRGGIVTALTAEGATRTFRRGRTIVRACERCDAQVRAGETTAIIGPSGSGKSTLAAMLAGRLRPEAGDVAQTTADGPAPPAADRFGGVQHVDQDPASAVEASFTVAAAVREPLDLTRALPAGARDDAVRAAVAAVGLPTDDAWLARRVGGLSGGQVQRLAIARAIVMRPAVLVADEPTSMLDASAAATVLRLIESLQHEEGFAMVLVTHDLAVAAKVADRLVVMDAGRVVESGPTRRLLASGSSRPVARLRRAALGAGAPGGGARD